MLTLMHFAGAGRGGVQGGVGRGSFVRRDDRRHRRRRMCSALKNAYATGLGLWDGLIGKDRTTRARRFHASDRRDAIIAAAAGGRAETSTARRGRRSPRDRRGGAQPRVRRTGRTRAAGEGSRGGDARRGGADRGLPAIATAWSFARERGRGAAAAGGPERDRVGGGRSARNSRAATVQRLTYRSRSLDGTARRAETPFHRKRTDDDLRPQPIRPPHRPGHVHARVQPDGDGRGSGEGP